MSLRALAISCGLVLMLSGGLPAQKTGAVQRVSIRSHDGFELAARFYSSGARGGAVLLIHQCNREGTATGLGSVARGLARHGIDALELDLRGFGESVNDTFDGKNWKEADRHHGRDVEAALLKLASLRDVEPGRIGILGASCGGRLALHLAQSHPEIRALVLLSAGLGRSPAVSLGEARRLPSLCIASEKDPYGKAADSMRAVFEISQHPATKLVLLKGDAHGAPLLDQDPSLEAAIVDWLSERLDQQSVPAMSGEEPR